MGSRLSPDFEPDSIDPRLLRRGKEITLLGILHMDEESQFPIACNLVIRAVRDWMNRDPAKDRFIAQEVSEALQGQVTEDQVRRVWEVLGTAGSFFDGHDGGFNYITVGSDGIARQYRRYQDMDALLAEAFEIQKPVLFSPAKAIRQPARKQVEAFEPRWQLVHPAVQEVSRTLFEQEHYRQAVLDALTLVEVRVRDHVRRTKGKDPSGRTLMEQAFSTDPTQAAIVLENLSTESGKNTQVGYQLMLSGALTAIRNPKAHEFVQVTPKRAFQFLLLATLFMERLDEAKVPAARLPRAAA